MNYNLNYLKQNKIWAAIIGLLLMGTVLYANTLNNQMFWDDNDFILNNQYIKDWAYIPQYFSQNIIAGSGLVSNYWRPVLLGVFSIEYHLWGADVFGYHLVNMLIHIADAILMFFLLNNLFKRYKLALLAATVFLIHPLQTESVAYVNSLGDSLSVFFMLLSLNNYLYFRQSVSWSSYWWSLGLFPLALMSKETAIALPFLVTLVEFFHDNSLTFKNRIKNIFRFASAFFAVAIFYVILRGTVLNFQNTFNLYNESNVFTSSITNRIFTFFSILATYVGLLFYPHDQHMERTIAVATSITSPGVWQGLVIFLLIVLAALWFWKKRPEISFGLAWFLACLSPTSNIAVPINGLLYEHWLYLPMAGFWLAFFVPVLALAKNFVWETTARFAKPIMILIGTGIVVYFVFFSAKTIIRNNEWSDPIKFYNQTIKYTPDSYRLHNNLGMAYADAGDLEKAKESYLRAVAINDEVAVAYHNLGNASKVLKERDQAIEYYQTAIKKDPDFVYSYNSLAQMYIDEGNYREAVELLEVLYVRNPNPLWRQYIDSLKERLK